MTSAGVRIRQAAASARPLDSIWPTAGGALSEASGEEGDARKDLLCSYVVKKMAAARRKALKVVRARNRESNDI